MSKQAAFAWILAAVVLAVRPAGADIIVDNLDPDYPGGSTEIPEVVSWYGNVPPSNYSYRRSAVRFVVPAGDFELDSITLPLRVEMDAIPTQNLRVRLAADSGTERPGSTIEVLSENEDIWPTSPVAYPPTVLYSTEHPVLKAGETYWIVVEPMPVTPGLVGTLLFHWRTNQCRSLSGITNQTSEVDPPADPWPNLYGFDKPAFRVEGTALNQVVGYPDPTWPSSPTENSRVHISASFDQTAPVAIPDGAGGALIAWEDGRSGFGNKNIFMQRVDDAGSMQWLCGGVTICAASGDQVFPAVIPDDDGGAIVAWQDLRADGGDIYVQAITADGVVKWAANGVPVCTAFGIQAHVNLAPDGAGGAILTWSDVRGANFDIYAQRVNAAGTPQWTANGVPVCTAVNTQWIPQVVSDGAGGAIFAWRDLRDLDYDTYAQRFNASGVAQWTANGIVVCNAINDQTGIQLVADGAGGAIAVWLDARSDINSYDIYAQHLHPHGYGTWGSNGIPVCVAGGSQINHRLASDGSGGVLIAWEDPRSGNPDIYVQRVTPGGLPMWTINGIGLVAVGSQINPVVESDGLGGVLVVWQDDQTGGDIMIGNYNPTGSWPPRVVCSAPGIQRYPILVRDGAHGAIAVWEDGRGVDYDLYAQRIERSGYLGNPEPAILSVADTPGDNGNQVDVTWRASYLETGFPGVVDEYRIWRSVPPAGSGVLPLSSLSASGSYTGDPEEAIRTGRPWVSIRSGAVFAWEYVNTVVATGAPTYVTSVDSETSGDPEAVFMVQARSDTGSPSLLSDPVSGRAIDDQAPAAPLGLSAQYAPGWIDLHWNPNPEPDVGEYRIYRGLSVDFAPDPGSLFAAGSDTAFSGPAEATYVYKVTAVDIHGNESAETTVTAWQTGVPEPGRARFILRAPSPNPARGSTAVSWFQADSGPVDLSLFDLRGARVAVIRSGEIPAGEYQETIPMRDGAGRPLASGLYFLRLHWTGGTESRRLTVIR